MKTNQIVESRKGHINKYGPIDCDDDVLMVQLGLRQPLIIRHLELNIKTKFEREALKGLISSAEPISRTSPNTPEPHEHIMGRLTVYLKNTEKSKTFKTTKTFRCYRSEVDGILEGLRNDKLTVNKHYFKY